MTIRRPVMVRGDLRLAADGAAALAVLSWGAGNVIVKALDDESLTLGFHRFWIASAIVGSLLVLRGRRLRMTDLRAAAPSGVAFALNTVCMFTALKLTTVANAAVIAGLQPIAVLFIATRRFGERVRPLDGALAAGAILSVAVVVYGSAGLPEWHIAGDAVAVLSLGTWTWYFVASKRARARIGALEHQVGVVLIGAIVMAPMLLLSGQDLLPQNGRSWLGVVLIVLVPGGGHVLLSWAHAHTSLSMVSLLTLGTPVVSAIGAAAVLREAVTVVQAAGMAAVLTFLVALVVRSAAFSAAPVTPPPGQEVPGFDVGPPGEAGEAAP